MTAAATAIGAQADTRHPAAGGDRDASDPDAGRDSDPATRTPATASTPAGDAATFAASAGAATVTSTPAPPAAASSATAVPVRLADLPEAVETTISLAGRDGLTEARIELSPAALGDIQIHLQHTEDGLVARVVAAHPEAAQALQSSSDDLRRSLEQNGTHLLSLDISTSGRGESERRGNGGKAGAAGSRGAGPDGPTDTSTAAVQTQTLDAGLTGAALVNVLA